ncbi:MAG: hypothetical protein BWY21_02222 [Parcubacteria group bacterium ADurb.Bin216]|nr:MAG: hypothetical protein BWY21_02222 [Parcubacteria group bacterium ADurb.Bin216]
MTTPTNLSFPTVAYNSIILNWTPGTGSTNTLIVRKQGSIPTSRTDGTTIYEDNGNAFIDTGLTDNTEYCYALYATDNTEYTEALTGCQTTQAITGLVSHWKFDEGTGTTAYDSAGTNHGTLTNGPTWKTSSDCISGGCLQFDGSNDYVNTGNFSSVFGINDITWSLWVKPLRNATNTTHTYDFDTIIGKHASGYSGDLTIGYIQNNILRVYYETPSGSGNVDSSTPLPINQWTHVVVTTNSSGIKLYINGILNNTKNYATHFIMGDIGIGDAMPTNVWTSYYNGLVDEVRFYNHTINQEQVASLFDNGIDSYHSIHGKCGSANGSNLYSTPTDNLCSYGIPSTVSGSGPWTWTCAGTSASVSCSASKSVDGECGTANKEFYATVTSYGSNTFCSIGSSSPISPAFPTSDNPVSWQCIGVNGGNAVTCTASKLSSSCISGGGLTCAESVIGEYTRL